jgi:hypothetical protein
VKTDRAVAAKGLIVGLENGRPSTSAATAGEPLSHPLRLQSGQLCSVRKAVSTMYQNLHAAFSVVLESAPILLIAFVIY